MQYVGIALNRFYCICYVGIYETITLIVFFLPTHPLYVYPTSDARSRCVLPFVCDVTGAQAALLLTAAIWLKIFACICDCVTDGLRNDRNKWRDNSSGASQSRNASRNRRNPSKSMSCEREREKHKWLLYNSLWKRPKTVIRVNTINQ